MVAGGGGGGGGGGRGNDCEVARARENDTKRGKRRETTNEVEVPLKRKGPARKMIKKNLLSFLPKGTGLA